jgi:hypothetical protein
MGPKSSSLEFVLNITKLLESISSLKYTKYIENLMIDLYFNEYIVCIIHFEKCWNPTNSHNIKLIQICPKPISQLTFYMRKKEENS